MAGSGAPKGTRYTLQTPGVLMLTFPEAGTQDRFNLPM
jgi:hypothetical protein